MLLKLSGWKSRQCLAGSFSIFVFWTGAAVSLGVPAVVVAGVSSSVDSDP